MTGLLRVRVVPEAGTALDLALPGRVPVADLLPELARLARLTTPARLVTAAGREVAPETGLAEQRVGEGAVLALVADAPGESSADDPAQALAAQVAGEVLGWHPRFVRPAGLVIASVLIAVGGAGLAVGPDWSGAVAAGVAALLGGAALFAARHRHDRLLATTCAWAGVGVAAVAGSQYAGAVAACLAAAMTALLLARALGSVGVLILPAAGAAVLLAGVAMLSRSAGIDVGLVTALGVAGVGLALPALPRVALSLTRDHDAGRDLLRALLAAASVVMVVLAAPASGSGAAGAGLSATVGVLVACRASRHHGVVEIAAGLLTGLTMLGAAGLITVLRHPEWGGFVGVAALLVAGTACMVALLGAPADADDPRWPLAIDRVEVAALVALVPLLVLIGGAVPAVDRLVGG